MPQKKRMGRWLAVIVSDYQVTDFETSTQYDIKLSYQIINIVPELKEVILPRHYLTYGNDDSIVKNDSENQIKNQLLSKLEVSPFTLGVSSITNPQTMDIQADMKPSLLLHSFKKIALLSFLFLATLLVLGYLIWGMPFSKKKQPFGDSLRALKQMQKQGWDNKQYDKALKTIHQAFNATASKIIFTEKIDGFFSDHKPYLPLKAEIESFFSESEQYFFKTSSRDIDSDTKPNLSPSYEPDQNKLNELIRFVRSCRQIEQGQL